MDFEMHYFPPSIFLADLEMQISLVHIQAPSPSKRAFEKHMPQGLFFEFYSTSLNFAYEA